MTELQKQIAKASQDYYSTGTSEISDEKFDMMLEELREQDPDDPLLTQVGHGYKLEEDTTFGDKVLHIYGPAGSLPKCHDFKEYSRVIKSTDEIWASLKLDGMSVVLYYKSGKLYLALTRGAGDGEIGIDITSKLKYICPEALDIKDLMFNGAVRGELLMTYSDFEKLKVIDPEASNPRNSAVGIVKAKEVDPEKLKLVSLFVYNVTGYTEVVADYRANFFSGYKFAYGYLTDHFPNCAPAEVINFKEDTFISTMDLLRDKWYTDYGCPADGIVLSPKQCEATVTYDETKYKTKNYYYKFNAVAFKYPAESKETTVIGVDWNLSKTKYLVPRINFETIDLCGTSVSWAHGDNALNIKNKKIGPGAVVEVMKRGEVIPHLERVIKSSDNVELPTVCPACQTKLEWNGMHLYCPNIDCGDAAIQDLLVWCKYIAPVDGLGDILKLKFMNTYLGQDNVSIEEVYEHEVPYELESTQWELFRKMYDMLLNRKVDLVTAIKALNVPRISEVNAEKLAKFPEIVKQLTQGVQLSFSPEIIKEVGNANCNSIIENAWKFERLNYIADNIDWSAPEEAKGKVAITGKLSVKRDTFEAELKRKGYTTSSSVTKDTFCLITDDPDSGSSKNAKADQLGIPKLSEKQFRQTYLS